MLSSKIHHQPIGPATRLSESGLFLQGRVVLKLNLFTLPRQASVALGYLPETRCQLLKVLFGIGYQHRQVQHVRPSTVLLLQGRHSLMDQAFHLMIEFGERVLALAADLFESSQFGAQRRFRFARRCLLAQETRTILGALLALLFIELALVPFDFRSRQGLGLSLFDAGELFPSLDDDES